MMTAFLADVRRYSGRDPSLRTVIGAVARNYGAQGLLVYRLGRFLVRASRDWRLIAMASICWPVYLPLRWYVRYALGIRLDLSAEIGAGFYIGHLGNIHLERCTLGRNCSIGQSTHIMPLRGGRGPSIGDHVWIGAHARIIGPHSIGSGSTVSAGGVVCQDVPAGAMCLGDPARVVARQYDNRRLLGLD